MSDQLTDDIKKVFEEVIDDTEYAAYQAGPADADMSPGEAREYEQYFPTEAQR